MPRIDPAAVLAACRARPECRVIWGAYGNGHDCGCPLTLFAVSLGQPLREEGLFSFMNRLGYDTDYLIDFTRGVDQCGSPRYECDGQGYADGTATRELLVREGVLSG